MTTSTYFSDVVVEIAFDSGFATPAASRTWTDVSPWVELEKGITITYGRQDERSQADANTLAVSLDNSDGRFTPGKASSPYFPNVKLYRPIRVTATPPGGTPSVRFVGYINQWPVQWGGSEFYASTPLNAASRLSRLGLMDERGPLLPETMATLSPPLVPNLYYPLGDPDGSTQAAEAYNGQPLLVAGQGEPLSFGQGISPAFSGQSAVTFAGGQFLTAAISLPVNTNTAQFWLAFSFATKEVNQPLVGLWSYAGPYTSLITGVSIDSLGGLNFAMGDGFNGTTVAYNDGLNHDIVIVGDATNVRLYIDGEFVVGSFNVPNLVGTVTRIAVGSGTTYTERLKGSVSEVMVGTSTISPATITEIHRALSTGFYGETSIARVLRYASWVNIPSAELALAGLTQTVIGVDSTGVGVVDLIRQIEVTESAVLYDSRDGLLTLKPQSGRYDATSAFTLDMVKQQVEADFSPQFDPATIVNDVTATRADGAPSARIVDADSKFDYGTGSSAIETLSTRDTDPFELASWEVARFAEPLQRVPSVTVDVTAQAGQTPTPNTLMAADIGTRFTVANQPSQAVSSTADYFVEGYTETFGPESHAIAFNVSPLGLYGDVLRFNSATQGFNSDYVFAL